MSARSPGLPPALPPALAPWAPQLAPFAPDLALVLGEWARRIAPALGGIPRRRTDAGEPDGLSGLSRRGPYERLLVSEWLLARELPDEFLRRAAAREHLFLATARRRGGAGLRSVVLFDAGPEQVGAPRIAQLAVLVVLAARALSAGAELRWGIVQEPEVDPEGGFSSALALRLLAARTRAMATDAALAAWRERLGAAAPADDLWLVGGARLASSAVLASALRLRIEDVVEPDARQVRLAVEARGALRREVVLELPGGADCVRLLRDPFQVVQATPVRAPATLDASSSALLLASSGRRGAVRLADAKVLDFHVPNSPRQAPGKARVVEGGYGLLAVGWSRGKPVTARTLAGEVRLQPQSREADGLLRPGTGVPLPAAPGLGDPLGALLFSRGRVWILDGAGTLYHAPVIDGARKEWTSELWVASVGVPAAIVAAGRVVYLAARDGQVELVVEGERRQALALGPGSGRAFLSAPGLRLLAAVEEPRGGTWRVFGGAPPSAGLPTLSLPEPRLLRPPSDTQVVGVTWLGQEPTLVLLEADRRDFTLLSARGLRLGFAAPEPVAAAAVSPAEATVVHATRSGGLAAWSLERGEALLRMQARGGA